MPRISSNDNDGPSGGGTLSRSPSFRAAVRSCGRVVWVIFCLGCAPIWGLCCLAPMCLGWFIFLISESPLACGLTVVMGYVVMLAVHETLGFDGDDLLGKIVAGGPLLLFIPARALTGSSILGVAAVGGAFLTIFLAVRFAKWYRSTRLGISTLLDKELIRLLWNVACACVIIILVLCFSLGAASALCMPVILLGERWFIFGVMLGTFGVACYACCCEVVMDSLEEMPAFWRWIALIIVFGIIPMGLAAVCFWYGPIR